MKRRNPLPQVEIKTVNPDSVLRKFKGAGGVGYKKDNGNLWLRGDIVTIKKMFPFCTIVHSVGQDV